MILTHEKGGRKLVAHACAAAAHAGVRPGTDLTHALSMLPAGIVPHVRPDRPARNLEALEALARRLLKISPLVAPDPPDGALLDITGTDLLHQSEGRVIRSITGGLRKLGVRVRIGAAGTFACARALARFAPGSIRSGSEREALEPLPVAALGVDASAVSAFEEIGILRVGDLLALPRASLVARFGYEILDRLDRALGAKPERLSPICPPEPLTASLLFEGPTDHPESIHAAAKQVLEELAGLLTRQEKGVRRLELELRRPDAPAETTTLTLSRSSRSIRHLWTLLRSRLERIDLRAGVEGVVLHAARTARLRHEQMNSLALGGSANKVSQAAWGELVDNLTDRLGPARVLCIDAAESHLPECAWKERPALEDPPRFRSAVTPADRPSRLYPRPEPAEAIALTPDGPVFDLSWRSRRWRVLACAGPERLGPEWWRWSRPSHVADPRSQRTRTSRPMPPDRDYFALQLETGLWVWACRQLRTRRWFVHGEWS